jgi:hypothetical protein
MSSGRPLTEDRPNDTLEWLLLMQHHGLPTRLLDWSKNAFTALYFAIRKHDQKQEIDAAVWVLDPRRLNEACKLGRSIAFPRPEQKARIKEFCLLDKPLKSPTFPIPLIPPHMSPRITAQRSRFTLHPDKCNELERFAKITSKKDRCWYLVKLRIPWSVQPRILRALRLVGVTQPEITPGLDSLATEILQRIELGVDDLEIQ